MQKEKKNSYDKLLKNSIMVSIICGIGWSRSKLNSLQMRLDIGGVRSASSLLIRLSLSAQAFSHGQNENDDFNGSDNIFN